MRKQRSNLPKRKVRSDMTIAFEGRLYCLLHLQSAFPGAVVHVKSIADTDYIHIEVESSRPKVIATVRPIVMTEAGFRADAAVIGA